VFAEQFFPPALAFVHRHRLQLIHDPRSHPAPADAGAKAVAADQFTRVERADILMKSSGSFPSSSLERSRRQAPKRNSDFFQAAFEGVPAFQGTSGYVRV